MAKDQDKEVHLKVVVNGKPESMKGNPDEPLSSMVLPSLEKPKVADRSEPERWMFKDEQGTVLDKARLIGSFGFALNTVLFLSLEAGVVG